jgi:hypothetical protein
MTTDKARKRAVRTRMDKTGERYAAARRHVVAATKPGDGEPSLPPRVADPGVSDEAIVKATGQDWDTWLRRLDAWGAIDRTHTEIARHLVDAYAVTGWWAQAVTVGFERARGRRAVHETGRGFEVSVSKTVHARAAETWAAVSDPAVREHWLEPAAFRQTTSRTGRWTKLVAEGDGQPSVAIVYVVGKTDDRTTVTVTHAKLADAADVARQRVAWRSRLAALAEVLADHAGVASDGGPSS